jgi:uncharacterized LabA/DUF88 family protein
MRWMLFVDGENLTIRAQEFAKAEGSDLKLLRERYLADVFVWPPQWDPLASYIFPVNVSAIRAYYYTSVTGDDGKIAEVKQALRYLHFDPQVFKKSSRQQKSKGVDITLTKDMLSHAYSNNYDGAVLIAGDGDYVPLIEEVKRRGKNVFVAFFAAANLGLNPDIPLVADQFFPLEEAFRVAFTRAERRRHQS